MGNWAKRLLLAGAAVGVPLAVMQAVDGGDGSGSGEVVAGPGTSVGEDPSKPSPLPRAEDQAYYNPEALSALAAGNGAFDDDDWDRASDLYGEAAAKDDELAEARYNEAQIYMKLYRDDPEGPSADQWRRYADDYLNQTLSVDPSYAVARYNLAKFDYEAWGGVDEIVAENCAEAIIQSESGLASHPIGGKWLDDARDFCGDITEQWARCEEVWPEPCPD